MTEKFPIFAAAVNKRFMAMSTGELLTVDSPDIFAVYLAAFPEGTNPIFRVRTEHDCSTDKRFIRNLGLTVQIMAGAIHTVWDVPTPLPYPYDVVARAMSEHVRALAIAGVFRTKERKFGVKSNVALIDDRTHTFHHFWGDVATRHWAAKPDEARGTINTTVQVFRRGLDELTLSALDTVLELIDGNALYRGAEFRKAVAEFRLMLAGYKTLNSEVARSLFAWQNFDSPFARFRNTAIGTLVQDLSAGEDLDKAVRVFESKVAPHNYKRTTALITPKMIELAVATLRDLGLEPAIERRFAKLSDVSVNNVLFVDRSVRGAMKDGIAGLLSDAVKPLAVKLDNAEPYGITEFMQYVVPNALSIDLLVENAHLGNFVSLTAPQHVDAGRLFKWGNGFAWSYDGEVADSIKERVKKAGGKIDAPVRVSLGWTNTDDLDLHVRGPGGHIYFGARRGHCGGTLDVDMNVHTVVRDPVENIYWSGKMPPGDYHVSVRQYNRRESVDIGCTVEIEAHGARKTFFYEKAVRGEVEFATLRVDRAGKVEIAPKGEGRTVTGVAPGQEKWGVKTQVLTPVNVLMASPNHWDGHETGAKHWFFMLKDCKNPDPVRGIYNEFLRGDLEPHRKVFEILGSKTKCQPTDDQLSGVGFTAARNDKVKAVVTGANGSRWAYEIQF